ncbi:antitoxin VbhA family protein [Clostridium estertheticum]|uniref:antitoxin VbhA family protein n=1 Tax=Clostridium estertheticum TaxID=238834 RepID=UPI001C0B0B3D|nr:antitoxin VbhA family protein [Clostridium estertheticum]MBU3174571.1 antitoxin VbhA family protein [Clostridium estertheticum]
MHPLKNNKLSKEDQLSLNNAKASLAIEGLIVTENETKILEDYINGLITEADFLKILNINCN